MPQKRKSHLRFRKRKRPKVRAKRREREEWWQKKNPRNRYAMASLSNMGTREVRRARLHRDSEEYKALRQRLHDEGITDTHSLGGRVASYINDGVHYRRHHLVMLLRCMGIKDYIRTGRILTRYLRCRLTIPGKTIHALLKKGVQRGWPQEVHYKGLAQWPGGMERLPIPEDWVEE